MSANLTTFTPLNTAVLFLVFNRLDTTKQVFEAIRLAKPPRLYIAADGARASLVGEGATVQAVRDYVVSHIDWVCEVKTLFREQNLGCKYAVSGAISWFFDNEEMGIILEDDVVPNPDFFIFCEHILEKYCEDERVMMATGTNYISNPNRKDAYFFSQYFTIWGWATWRRSWLLYDVTMKLWDSKTAKDNISYKFNNSYIAHQFRNTFDSVNSTNIDTWDIQWVFSCLYNSGLCATPRVNLISNIGVHGTHSNSVTSSHFLKTNELHLERNAYSDIPVTVDALYDSSLHELISKPALRKTALLIFLKRFGFYKPIRFFYRRFRFIFS